MSAPSRTHPFRTVAGTIALVAACTLLLPTVSGYGTVWSQWLQLGAWTIVAKFTASNFADLHRNWVEGLTIVLSVVAFAIPAGFAWTAIGSQWPRLFRIVLIAWTIFYLAALFFLFPAFSGP